MLSIIAIHFICREEKKQNISNMSSCPMKCCKVYKLYEHCGEQEVKGSKTEHIKSATLSWIILRDAIFMWTLNIYETYFRVQYETSNFELNIALVLTWLMCLCLSVHMCMCKCMSAIYPQLNAIYNAQTRHRSNKLNQTKPNFKDIWITGTLNPHHSWFSCHP